MVANGVKEIEKKDNKISEIKNDNGYFKWEGTDTNDYYEYPYGSNTSLDGKEGNDILVGNNGDDTLIGGEGNDILVGNNGDDTLIGGEGNDRLYGGKGNNTFVFSGDAGNDTVVYNRKQPNKSTVDTYDLGDNTITGLKREGNDIIIEYESKDGKKGSVRLYGYLTPGHARNGADIIKDSAHPKGQKLSESEFYIEATDTEGTFFNDHLHGTEDSEFFEGQGGSDIIEGNGGNDTIYGNDQSGDDTIHGDTIYGGDGNDLLAGFGGNDSINGGEGNDILIGGTGDDTMEGGTGNDLLYGGKGSNTFVFGDDAGNDTVVYDYKNTDNSVDTYDLGDNTITGLKREGNDIIIEYESKDGKKGSVRLEDYLQKGRDGSDIIKDSAHPDGQKLSESDFYIESDDTMGTPFNDHLHGTEGDDTIKGLTGNDIIEGNGGNDSINGNQGNDTIYGGDGEDIIGGGKGNDVLYGGANDDYIDGNTGNDTIYGGDGDDIISGGHGSDYIDGGDGEDDIYGDEGDDTIKTGTGEKGTIDGDSGNDYIDGSASSSISNAYGGNGNDTIKGSAGDDHIWGDTSSGDELEPGNDSIEGGAGNDTIEGQGGNDYIDGGTGNDSIKGGSGKDTLYGGAGGDFIGGGDGNDYIDGGDGNDTINGSKGRDTIYGGTGNDSIEGGKDNDIIYGGDGDDTINGGDGNNTLYGGTGQNTYVFGNNKGENKYTIYSDAVSGSSDILDFSDVDLKGLNEDDSALKVKRKGDDLVLHYGKKNKKSTVTVKDYFKDGDKKDFKVKLSEDEIYDLKDFVYLETNMEKEGEEGEGSTSFEGTFLKDKVTGTKGDDEINGRAGDDTLNGGAGNDKLYGGSGNNTYVFGEDSNSGGNDTIYSSKGSSDIIDFSQKEDMKNESGLKVENKDGDLVLKYGTDKKDSITIEDYFEKGDKDIWVKFKGDGEEDDDENNKPQNLKDIAYTETEMKNSGTFEGTFLKDKVKGSEGDDVIYGGLGDDEINAGEGNDKIYSDGGHNTYTFKAGDGDDTIYSVKGNDTVVFEGDISKDSVSASKKGNDLIIDYGEGGHVTLKDFFKNGTSVQKFKFGSNDEKGMSIDEFVRGKLDVDKIPGLNLVEDENYRKDDKNLSIKGSVLSDTVKGGSKTDTVKAGAGNDSVDGYEGNDKLYGEYGDDTLLGGAGDDLVNGGEGDDSITGGTGNDKLYGGAGENTYVFNVGDGNDTLYIDKKSSKEVLYFGKYTKTDDSNVYLSLKDLKFSSKGNDLTIHYYDKDGKDSSVTLSGYLKSLGSKNQANVQLKFQDENGNEFYEDLGKLVTEGSVLITFTGVDNKKNSIKGTRFSDYIEGKKMDDTLRGNDGNDKIVGGDGNDKLYGGGSVDNSDGTVGGNAFWFDRGSGNDTLYYTKPGKDQSPVTRDFIVFKDNDMFNEENSSFSRHNNDLIIEYNVGNDGKYQDSLTIKDYYKHGAEWDLYFDYASDFDAYKVKDGLRSFSDTFAKVTDKKYSFKNEFLGKEVKGELYNGLYGKDTSLEDKKGRIFLSNGSNAELLGDEGNDYYRSTSKYAYANDKGGNDQYFADNFISGVFEINDEGGSNDQLIVDETCDNLHVFFDVDKDKGIFEADDPAESEGDLYIFGSKEKSALEKGIKGEGKWKNSYKGVVVDDYFTYGDQDGSIESVGSSDGQYLDYDSLREIAEQVQNWLKTEGYESAMDVLESGDKKAIQDLLAIYEQADWNTDPQLSKN